MFKSKADGSLTIIDWQSVGAGPAGVDLIQGASACLTNDEDYAKLPELIANYYEKLPAKMKESYSLQQVKDDFGLGTALIYFGGTSLLCDMFPTLPHDNALWTLIGIWSPRLAQTFKALDTLTALRAVRDSL